VYVLVTDTLRPKFNFLLTVAVTTEEAEAERFATIDREALKLTILAPFA
jgi:hypothetical protein